MRVTEGGNGDYRQVRRTGGGAQRPVVVEATGWSEFSNNGGVGGFRRGCVWGEQKMRAFDHKTEATSRRLGSKLRRSRGWSCQLHNVLTQRIDVTEGLQIQRRDVGIQCRNVPESGKTDIATLRSNITMF